MARISQIVNTASIKPNVMYDGILRITMPEGARLIGFADVVDIVVTAKKLPDAERNEQAHG